jgi:hypothetical protein
MPIVGCCGALIGAWTVIAQDILGRATMSDAARMLARTQPPHPATVRRAAKWRDVPWPRRRSARVSIRAAATGSLQRVVKLELDTACATAFPGSPGRRASHTRSASFLANLRFRDNRESRRHNSLTTRARELADGRVDIEAAVDTRPHVCFVAPIRQRAANRRLDGAAAVPAARPHFRSVACSAVSARLPLFAQSSHAAVVAPIGVEEQSSPAARSR